MTCGMLDEHSNEALQRTEWCTVNHYRTLLCVVLCCIFEVETDWEVVVHLDSTELPTTSDSILYHTVELRTIESSFAFLLTCVESTLLTSLDDSVLS